MKESFIMHNSFYEPIKTLKNEQLGKLLRAIFNYTTSGEITQDNEILIAFMFIKNQIDMDANKWEEKKKKRSEAGRLGGIKRAVNENQALSSKSKQCLDMLSNAKQSQANQAVNVNDNVNVNVNVNDNVNNNSVINNKYIVEDNNVYKEIIDYLNQRTSQHYKYNSKNTKDHIKARLKEGFTVDDFKTVIDKMCVEWMNTDMQKYLRPETLFRPSKFESYLNREVKLTTKNITLSTKEIENIFG